MGKFMAAIASPHHTVSTHWTNPWRRVWQSIFARKTTDNKAQATAFVNAKRLMTMATAISKIDLLQQHQPDKLWHICKTAQRAADLAKHAGCSDLLQDTIYRLTFVATLHLVSPLDLDKLSQETTPEFIRSLKLILEARDSIFTSTPKFYPLRYKELVVAAVLLRRDLRNALNQKGASNTHSDSPIATSAPHLLLARLSKKTFSDPDMPAEIYRKTLQGIKKMIGDVFTHTPSRRNKPHAPLVQPNP